VLCSNAKMLNERPTNSVCHTTIVSCLTKASAINSAVNLI